MEFWRDTVKNNSILYLTNKYHIALFQLIMIEFDASVYCVECVSTMLFFLRNRNFRYTQRLLHKLTTI